MIIWELITIEQRVCLDNELRPVNRQCFTSQELAIKSADAVLQERMDVYELSELTISRWADWHFNREGGEPDIFRVACHRNRNPLNKTEQFIMSREVLDEVWHP